MKYNKRNDARLAESEEKKIKKLIVSDTRKIKEIEKVWRKRKRVEVIGK